MVLKIYDLCIICTHVFSFCRGEYSSRLLSYHRLLSGAKKVVVDGTEKLSYDTKIA